MKLRSYTLPILGEYDYRRLKLLVKALRQSETRDRSTADALHAKLERAVVTHPREIPADVVTLYSTIRFSNTKSHEDRSLTLVFPGETRDREDCTSVLAPVGLALLGEHCGAVVECRTPEGATELRIEEVIYQPEATGAYYV